MTIMFSKSCVFILLGTLRLVFETRKYLVDNAKYSEKRNTPDFGISYIANIYSEIN